MDLENVYMGRIVVVDLDQGTCEEEEYEEEMLEEPIGGAAVNLELYKKYIDRDPIIIGTGLLTGTFAPSSCAGTVTAKSPVTGRVCHVPLLWQTAMELKYTGFDFIVILGKAEKLCRLWLHDELAEVADAEELRGKDVWQTTDWLRDEHGDDYVQVISIGPAGEKGCSIAQLSENLWGSRDVFGLGAAFGGKNLKAVALRGMGSLEVADGFFEDCLTAQNEIRKGAMFAKQGLVSLLEAVGVEAQDLQAVKQKVHRNSASFNCAYAYNTFLMIEEPADLLKESQKDEPGLLLTDPAGVIALLPLKDGLPMVLAQINRLGLDPNACGALLSKEGISDPQEAEKRVKEIASNGIDLEAAGVDNVYGVAPWPRSQALEDYLIQALAVFSHSLPTGPVGDGDADYSGAKDASDKARWWMERMAACSILGICPLSSLLSPEFTFEKMAQWGAKAADWDELTGEKLQEKSRKLIAETLSMGEDKGSVPSGWASPDLDAALQALRQAWE